MTATPDATTPTVYLAGNNKIRLGRTNVGKSCIRFKKLEPLNLEVAVELVRRAADSELTI